MTRLGVVLFVFAALLGACGDDDAATTDDIPAENTPAEPEVKNEVTVRLTEFALDPADADAGEAGLIEIAVVNAGDAPHSLAVVTPAGPVELDGRIEPGGRQTLAVDLDTPGAYDWYCPLDGHRERGMDGSISVGGEGAARGSDPARTTPGEVDTDTTETTTRTQTQTQTRTQTRTTTQTETVTTPTETEESPTATVRTPGAE